MISILIITHNNEGTIEDCLLSLTMQTRKDFEVVLIDNGSHDGTGSLIEAISPSIEFPFKKYYLELNLGFAGGNQYALQQSSGDLVALLNPDAFPEPDWLEKMVHAIDSGSDIGICASRMLSFTTNAIDCAGDGFAAWLKGFKRGEGDRAESYCEPGYVFGACAGAGLYRRNMLDDIGFLDEDFFLFHEDTDLNFRAQLAGWKVYYVPAAIVRHKVRHSVGDMSDLAVYYSLRNVEWVRIKNVPASLLLRYLPVLFIYEILEFCFFVIRYRRFSLYLRAKTDALRMFPRMLQKRSSIQKSRRVSTKDLRARFTPLLDRRSLMTKGRRMIFG